MRSNSPSQQQALHQQQAFHQQQGVGGTSYTKAVLYYSQFCKLSSHAVLLVTSQDLRARFALVCVERDRHLIPPGVDSVPMIFVGAPARKLLADADVFAYIEECSRQVRSGAGSPSSAMSSARSPVSASQAAGSATDDPSAAAGRGGDAYSFLEEGDGAPGDGAPGRSKGG